MSRFVHQAMSREALGARQKGRLVSSSKRLSRFAATLVTAALVTLGTTGTSAALPAAPTEPQRNPGRATEPGLYVVTLIEQPAAVYAGGVPGFRATRARSGQRFDRTRPAVVSYQERLREAQDRLLESVGNPEVRYRFTTALNGFAAELDSTQVKELRVTKGVALVEKSSMLKIDTVETPGFLGLAGAWAQAGGPDKAGKGIVIGIIDSGIWPENPSFAGLPSESNDGSRQPRGFHGGCATGTQWDAADCNSKVISARYFLKGFGQQNVAKSEYLSPRDGSGHGSHTASIAAGNHDVAVRIDGQDFGEASGMAPAARIAAYKVCWAAPDPDDDGCATADAVAAIDQAVADGVDVINYSVSGAQTAHTGPKDMVADSVGLAFLNASASGVVVVASAGNNGPGPGAVGHSSPWVTTVGASNHEVHQGSVVLGDGVSAHAGKSFPGAMVSDEEVDSRRIVLAEDVAVPGVSRDEARICKIGSLDTTRVQDTIVVCDRGKTARVDKSAAVALAGGVGMILVNVAADDVDADFHSVPAVHVDVATGQEIKSYVSEEGDEATARIDPDGVDDAAVPQIAEFSSRGPSLASNGDILKPDIAAPGVSIMAAVAPASNSGRLWDLYSGTSMSSPYVAGLAAFIRGVHPDWSPARIKSAMMTAADDLRGDAGPFDQGSGQINPEASLDPGLVFDANVADYLAYLAGQGFTYSDGSPVSDNALAASDLNLPSIAVGSLVGGATVTRRVTNVSDRTETFNAQIDAIAGVTATVKPSRALTLAPGESARITITFEANQEASPGKYAEGALTLTGLTRQLVLPIVIKPELVDAPDEVVGSGSTGAVTTRGVAGADTIDLRTAGLVGATPTGVSLVPGTFDPTTPRDAANALGVPLEVPAGTELARFALDAHNQADDMDMFVYRGDELVARSASETASETVTLVNPEEGDYTVYVASYSAANGSTTSGQLFSWMVGEGDDGTLSLPEEIDDGMGERFSFQASWEDLDMTYRWFGAIRYGDSGHRTLITIK